MYGLSSIRVNMCEVFTLVKAIVKLPILRYIIENMSHSHTQNYTAPPRIFSSFTFAQLFINRQSFDNVETTNTYYNTLTKRREQHRRSLVDYYNCQS